MTHSVLLTCEHAGCMVPPGLLKYFMDKRDLLMSHRGWDPYAWEIARNLQKALRVPLLIHRKTRLIVEVNRSLRHPQLFSEITRSLPEDKKADILRRWYHPHRNAVKAAVKKLKGTVAHLGIHTFTPVLHGKVRALDVGLLFDPKRPMEARLCEHLRSCLAEALPELRIRFNAPYKGTSDGLTTALRRHFPAKKYMGIEVEVSQAMRPAERRAFAKALAACLVA